MDKQELDAKGRDVAQFVMGSIAKWQNNSPRTLQSTMRILGMSELGGCREYIRASVAGDPKKPSTKLKWAAFLGTAVGDLAERALTESNPGEVESQTTVQLTLPESGISITGHTDAIIDGEHNCLIDFKTKDGLEEVTREGPSFKEYVQLSGYLIAAIESGRLPAGATAHLLYIDRSGKIDYALSYNITEDDARSYLLAADDRLKDVAHAIATGKRAERDMPESWCFHVECPFYDACWEGYIPTEELTAQEHIDGARIYDEGRDMEKRGIQLKNAGKQKLRGVTGATPDFTVNWQLRESPRGDGTVTEYIDVRKRRKP